MVKKLFLKILFLIFFSSSSFACPLLSVDIGTPVRDAQNTFEFLMLYKSELFEKGHSAKYQAYAADYCENSNLENTDLEVIIYDSKVAGINLISTDSEIKNEIYNFVKNNISDPGSEAEKENWVGYKDLSLGNLVIMYSKISIRDEIFEVLEITNPQMMDYTTGEEVIEVMG